MSKTLGEMTPAERAAAIARAAARFQAELDRTAPAIFAVLNEPQPGDVIELVSCTDPHTQLTPGTRGVVTLVDSLGTVHARWDDGSTLGLIPGVDTWRIIPRSAGRS